MQETDTGKWDEAVDLLVVGSGAGAMTAALVGHDAGGNTLLIEKSDLHGGSSAMSGGGLWVPNNHLMAGVGIEDDPEDAWTYLRETTAGDVSEDRLRTYLEKAPEMVEYLSEQTRAEFVALPEYADYYQRVAGSRPGGRALEPKNFDASLLGDEFLKMREQNYQMLIMKRIFMTVYEARTMLCRTPGWIGITMKLMAKYWLDIPWRFKSRRDRNLAMGNALVGMLRRSLMDRGIPLWLNTPARELIVEDGRVAGVAAQKEGSPIRIRARNGVVLAAGGLLSLLKKRRG
jgi:3-oxosteroid 1-dehydrogenase